MTNVDPVVEAMRVLERRRTEALEEVKRLDMAIVALSNLTTAPASELPAPVFVEHSPIPRPSVKTMMLALLGESDRDWSVNEVLAEYESRGTPVQAQDPSNALRAAVAEANKVGQIFRTATGRYKASKWRATTGIEPQRSFATQIANVQEAEQNT